MVEASRETGSIGGLRVNFHSVFAGVIVALSLQMLTLVLGDAISVSLLNPAQLQQGLRTLSAGPVLWTLLIPLATFFIGGLVASATARIDKSSQGILHGVIVWGLGLLFFVALISVGSAAIITSPATRLTGDVYWLLFFSACLAFVAAAFGGYLGSHPVHRSIYAQETSNRSGARDAPREPGPSHMLSVPFKS